jgi:hypothetical protein
MPTRKMQSEHKTLTPHPTTSAAPNNNNGASDRQTILSKMKRVTIPTPIVVGVAALFTFKRRWIVNFATSCLKK